MAFAMAGWMVGGARAAPPDQDQPRVEMWSGGEAFDRIWSVYTGASFAPFGSVREDGFRLRAVVGYGDHGSGTVSFADLLVGYHAQLGPVTLKVFAGLAAEDRRSDEPGSPPQGVEVGAKGAAEVWWNITDQVWTSVDLSAASLHSLYSARIRLGWRLWPELSSGLEGGSAGTTDHDIARFGGFLRYEWATGELSLSAGLAMDGPSSHWHGPAGPFGTLSVLMRF
jgi:Cellulose biosynthesis protein BcsS